MAQVIQEQGPDAITKTINVDATGMRFDSIIAIEGVKTVVGAGAPEMNALVNPGAISATSMERGATADAVCAKIIGIHSDCAGRPLTVLQDVYTSEANTTQRNQAIGALLVGGIRVLTWSVDDAAAEAMGRQVRGGFSAVTRPAP